MLADRNQRADNPVEQTVTETVPAEAPDVPVKPSGFTDRVLPDGTRSSGSAVPADWLTYPHDGETPR